MAAIAGSRCSEIGNRHGIKALRVQNKPFDCAIFCANTPNKTRGLEILTPARRNQCPARPADVQRWLNRLRERIEGAFHEVQNTGRHLEHLTCRTLRGLRTHVAAKMTSHALKLLLRGQDGIDVRTFTVAG